MKISVYGSAAGDITDEVLEKAKLIGKEIAKLGHNLVTGACPGIPYEAVLGAKEFNGKVVGFSPAVNLESHKALDYPVDGFTELIFLPEDFKYKDNKGIATKHRNVESVAYCDACVIIGGRAGTLNEFTIAYDAGKIIGVLENSGGVTKFLKELVNDFNKQSDAKIIYDEDPFELVKKIVEEAKE